MEKYTYALTWVLVGLADIGIWLGVYYLVSRAFMRIAERNGGRADLGAVRLFFVIVFLLLHTAAVFLGVQLRYHWIE
ncbi:MAG: hypothetical protein K6C68_04770 [Ruminococcus sp.]|nr:hypothetical protein [Ruminococcus sp.]